MKPSQKPPWREVRLGDILTERTETPNPGEIETGMIPIVAKISFSEGTIELRDDTRTRTKMILIRPGDLVVSGINAAKGAIAIYDEGDDLPIAATIHYAAYIPDKSRVDVRYLWWLLRSVTFRDILKRNLPGGVKTELKAKRLLPIQIPLPPLDEQRRIVARIEELAVLIEEAQALRVKAREEAEAFLAAIAKSLFDDDHQWTQVTIGKLVGRKNLRNGKSVKETPLPTDIHCLRLSAMRGGRIDFDDAKPVLLTDEEAEPFLVHPGDVFVMRGSGSKQLVGQAGIAKESVEGTVFPDLLIRVPLDSAKVLPSFFVAWWNSPQMREVIEDAAKTTSGIWKINQGHIASFPIPLAPLSEQYRIVAYLDNLQAQVDELTALQESTQAELDALLPSVLDRAFRGEL